MESKGFDRQGDWVTWGISSNPSMDIHGFQWRSQESTQGEAGLYNTYTYDSC